MTHTTQIIDRYLTDKEPDSAATFSTYALTTDHASSSYGMPVLVGPNGTAYGPEDTLPNGEIAANALFFAEWDSSEAVDASNRFRGVDTATRGF